MIIETNEQTEKGFARSVLDWLDSVIVSLFIVIIAFTFLFSIVGVIGPSMENTLFEGNKLVISNFLYTPKNGDIVIISRNYDNLESDDAKNAFEEPIVKRVIAVAGQKLKICDGEVYVDGVKLKENYITSPTENRDFPTTEQTVPDGHIFVMGDNRYVSHDSRSSNIGMVDTRYVMGKVLFRFYPFSKFEIF